MRKLALVLIAFLSGIVGTLTVRHFSPAQTQISAPETAYARVMRTGVLRCGYWNWAPILMPGKDGQTLTGIFYDFTEQLGKALSLKIEWTQEVGFATFGQDLAQGKVDAVCGGVWPLASRGRVMEFTDALYYLPIRLYVRADDHRFDNNTNLLNDAQITFGTMDGWASNGPVQQYFPKAKLMSLPDLASVGEVYDLLVAGKADIVANDVFTSQNFIDNNPGKIRELPTARPLDFFANTIAVKKGEQDLITMLNTGIRDLTNSGVTEDVIKSYETTPHMMLRPALPYRQD